VPAVVADQQRHARLIRDVGKLCSAVKIKRVPEGFQLMKALVSGKLLR
jgi:hypothetical protein